MAIIVNKREDRSELQQRIAAELREKQKSHKLDDELKAPEYDNENSSYLKDTKQTTSLAWAWAIIGIGMFGTIIAIIIAVS